MYPDISHILHEGRSRCLTNMPKINGTMLSAGCAGLSFFDWIEKCYGKVEKHIGIELYSPKPDNLPSHIEWIANTVGNMCDVKNESCELVFSGQNIEHLWADEMLGFFLESWRVLKPGGYLVVDSPNRAITEPLVWSHPEHTVEFTPSEARHLVELAGFDVTALHGIWLCRDTKTHEMMCFDPKTPAEKALIEERINAATNHPDQSFIWWLEAKRADRAPDVTALTNEITAIFDEGWSERIKRFINATGTRQGNAVFAKKHERGALMFGPFMPLKAGDYRVSFSIELQNNASSSLAFAKKLQYQWSQWIRNLTETWTQKPNTKKWHRYFKFGIRVLRRLALAEPVLRFDILGNQGREIIVKELSHEELLQKKGHIELTFSLKELEFGIQARCISYGKAALLCNLPLLTNLA